LRLAGNLRRLVRGPFSKRNLAVFDREAPVVVLSPHFDDSVLDFWSVLTAAREVAVLNVFAGLPRKACLTDWDRFCGATDSVEWTKRRSEEDARALALAGRTAINLPLVQRSSCLASGEPPAELADIASAVGAVLAAASAVYAPAAIGEHPDHVLVREFALLFARCGMPTFLAADLPYAVRSGGWPIWVAGPAGVPAADDEWRPFLAWIERVTRGKPRLVRLGDEEVLAKLAAARAHETQFRHLDGEAQRLSRVDNLRFEVFWEVNDVFSDA
jgi:LmbE family N-acetylglucosaminyl deacetylase